MGSIIGHRIDGSGTYPAKINPSTPPPGKEISIFLLGTWNLYLQEIIFVNDVAVLTIETTKLVFKPVFLKQFQFLKP